MIFVWIYILIGLFVVSLTYFEFTPALIQIFLNLETYGAPSWFIDWVIRCYNIGFIVLAVGIIIYGILQAVKEEPTTYQ